MNLPLSDTFGRVHNYLRISLTERCNMRCNYCMPEHGVQLSPDPSLMTNDEVLAFAKLFVKLGVKKIRLTGGEPLLRKNIENIIEEIAQLPVELTLTTNGLLVDKYIPVFKKSGIKSINVSLDSLKREKYFRITRRDNFEKVKRNIDLLAVEGFRVKVNAVIMKGVNDDEISQFVDWTKENELHVRFIEFMPFDGNNWDWSKGISLHEILEKIKLNYGTEIQKIADKKNDTSKNYRIKNHKGTFAIISTVTSPFCDTCNRIRLTADGKIKNCLFSNTETDLLSTLRAGGNVEELILKNILLKKAVRAGMTSFSEFSNPKKNTENRSMILIGG